MSLTSKAACISVLLCSFLLILATGQVNVRNFEKVQNSIEEIYADRLVVKGLIYNLSSLLHKKEVALYSKNQSFFKNQNEEINKSISSILKEFRATRLTVKEENTLEEFSRGIKDLKSSEKEMNLSSREDLIDAEVKKLTDEINGLKKELDVLSGIQLSEGEQKLRSSDKAVKEMLEFESLEKYALIFIGFLVVVLIFIPGSGRKES